MYDSPYHPFQQVKLADEGIQDPNLHKSQDHGGDVDGTPQNDNSMSTSLIFERDVIYMR
jgi:hypothetical protein